MVKKITIERNSEVTYKLLNRKEIQRLFTIHDDIKSEKAIKTMSLINLTGSITPEQFFKLFWFKPYITPKIDIYKVFWNPEIDWKIILNSYKKILHIYKVVHNYLNINNIIKVKHKDNTDIIFDQNYSFRIHDKFQARFLRPDWVIYQDWKYIFIETDTWHEKSKKLITKCENYKDYLTQEVSNHSFDFKDIKIIFFSHSPTRLNTIKAQEIFKPLELLDLIEYSLNW